MKINRIGIVGAGQMGGGIAQVAAASGYKVKLADANRELAEKGKAKIEKGLRKLVDKGKIDAGKKDTILANIEACADLEAFKDVDLAIEAVSEDENLKFTLFRELDRITPATAILASNTSSISITRIAKETKRPDKVIGMHFMNPVPIMKLVEVIRGMATANDTFEVAQGVCRDMGKETVCSKDYPGFIVNRILMPMINEAVYALYEGLANVEDIDAAMKLGTNVPMGPLTLADFIGLDTCLAIMEVLHRGLGDGKYRPCPLLRQYVDCGRLGRKSGHGFYQY